MTFTRLCTLIGAVACIGMVVGMGARGQANTAAAQAAPGAVQIDTDDIGGVVTSAAGPEAGVWVIAETADLPTKFRRIVVTDDRGRYVVPDLPKASYRLWVRGYGLVDSPAVQASPGQRLPLTAVVAPNALAAAQYYPSDYWFSLLQVPPKESFPLAPEPAGRGAREGQTPLQGVESQAEWVSVVKGCVICHQMGSKATREIPRSLGTFDSSFAAWDRRVRAGQNASGGINGVNRLGHDRALALFADWTDRIGAGEVPPAPPRPQGLERNLVVTLWDFGSTTAFLHDVVASNKNSPTANAYGPIYGAEWSHNSFEILDPRKHTKASLKIPLKDERDRQILRAQAVGQSQIPVPSPYWGEEIIWEELLSVVVPHIDSRGYVWYNGRNKAGVTPDWCRTGSNNPFAKNWPIENPPANPDAERAQPQAQRAINFYNPKTGTFGFVDTCFSTHHIQIAADPDETVFASGFGLISWVNSRVFLETGD
ncbi:MAG: carboxypeptidase-like regulatory domain-containing protein, partial [Vicinamibacterales bacterium]